MKVLLVVGSARSGSTILGNVLGSIEGFCHLGEIQRIWQRGLLENWLCGCGKRFLNCFFWTAVLESAYGRLESARVQEIEDLRVQVHRQLTAYRGEIDSPETREYEGQLEKLYRAIAAVSSCSVLIDTSKTAAHGWSLERVRGVELRLVHFVRDPRAVAYSWSRKKALPDSTNHRYMNQRNVEEASSIWNTSNLRAEWLVQHAGPRATRIRYEDFAASPRAAVQHVVALLSETGRVPDLDGGLARLKPCHTISGNPGRFEQVGLVEIRPDNEWQTSMSKGDISFVTQMTADRLKLYGYAASVVEQPCQSAWEGDRMAAQPG